MKSIGECLNYAKSTNMNEEDVGDFLQRAMQFNLQEANEFFMSAEYTELAKKKYVKLNTLSETELISYLQKVEKMPSNSASFKSVPKDVLTKLLQISLLFIDMKDLISTSFKEN